MESFILKGIRRIANAGLRGTVGFHSSDVPWMSTEGIAELQSHAKRGHYIHQHHHYPVAYGRHTLPHANTSPIRPCLLGEFPTAMGTPSIENIRWRDKLLRETESHPDGYLQARLSLIEEYGYDGAMFWGINSTDNRSSFNATQQKQIRAFAGR